MGLGSRLRCAVLYMMLRVTPGGASSVDRKFALRVLNSLTHGDTEYGGLKVSLSESSLPLYLLRHQTTLGPLGLV